MTKEELSKYINTAISNVDFISNICAELKINDKNVEFFQNVLIAKNYLSIVFTDLANDIIPVLFYYKIFHNIEELKLDVLLSNQMFRQKDKTTIDISRLKNLLAQCDLKKSYSFFSTYKFYSSLHFFQDNIVIVGANGCGKSTLSSMLKDTIDERDGVVIPAQKLLIIPTFNNTPNLNSSSKEYEEFEKNYTDSKTTYNASQSNDIPYNDTQRYGREYKVVLKKLLADRGYTRNIFCNKIQRGESPNSNDLYSKLDKAIDIWNSLIQHRTMFCDDNNQIQLKTKDTDEIYPAYKMSDGEKIILYLIGRVLLAHANALIVIDEPEIYLHKAIVNKLWDKLEAERNDCLFVYLTHDLDFASTREAYKYWISSFRHPMFWTFDPIPKNGIPENLLMKLLGSRKKILFCEGKKGSWDKQIYEILFPEYTITPLETCSDVINYTRAFNKIPNKDSEAFGIIDRDFRVEEQIEKLKIENIYSYFVAEIENLFLSEQFVIEYEKFKNEENKAAEIKEKIFSLFEKHKKMQISNYVSSYINYCFKESHIKKGNTKEDVISNYNIFNEKIKIEEWFSDREALIDKVIREKDYKKAILLYNNKGLHSAVEDVHGLKPNTYREKALSFLRNSEVAKQILKAYFPDIV